jgi:tRNA A-37 threonylcarbamoyl transferase component Bud32
MPDDAELRAWLRGTLSGGRCASLEAWLASLPPAEAEARLAALDRPGHTLAITVPTSSPNFTSERATGRLVTGDNLGVGGMATVVAAHDRALDRQVALKVLRPRLPAEDLETYLLREAAFRREAALTAALDHPAIVPVHDVGRVDGRPAFTMKRLDGNTFDRVVADRHLPLAELVRVLLHVAEAVASAHSRGIVHRDLTPANVLVGAFGAVYVLDWGLAGRSGSNDGIRAGTPGWMAPEQAQAAVADPRLDVYALGGLLALVLADSTPKALAAVATRCRASDPAERYADAGAVADELRRWLDDGVTLAQETNAVERAWLRLRQSPRLRAGLAAAGLAALAAMGAWRWTEQAAEERTRGRLAELEHSVPLDRPEAIGIARAEVEAIRREHPRLPEAVALAARLETAQALARTAAAAAEARARLDSLLRRTREIGPWGDQVQAWQETLLQPGGDPATVAAARAFLWRAQREQDDTAGAAATAAQLAGSGPGPGWQALGRLLSLVAFRAHDPVLCLCEDSEAVLADAASAAVALALFAPEPRLTAYARARLLTAPGDFWPLIAAARAALAAHDTGEAERLAFIASGAEPGSLLPRLVLAYVALSRQTWSELLVQADRGLAADPGNSELLALRAVALARLGRREEAQAVIDHLPATHLRYHLSNRVGHPMELAVDALVAAGVTIAPAEPDLGPLTPPHRHH